MDFNALVQGFVEHPAAAIAALSILANVYQYRENQQGHKTLLETALSVLPVATKLAEGVESLERREGHHGG